MTAALLLAGFASLAGGTWRQSRLLFGRQPPDAARLGCRALGFALLASALLLALAAPDPARAVVEWAGLATLAALVVLGACWLLDRAG